MPDLQSVAPSTTSLKPAPQWDQRDKICNPAFMYPRFSRPRSRNCGTRFAFWRSNQLKQLILLLCKNGDYKSLKSKIILMSVSENKKESRMGGSQIKLYTYSSNYP